MDRFPQMALYSCIPIPFSLSEGGIFLGASCLTGRTWAGSLWYFDKVESAPDVERCLAGVELDTGLNDLALVSDNIVFVGLDTGMGWTCLKSVSFFRFCIFVK